MLKFIILGLIIMLIMRKNPISLLDTRFKHAYLLILPFIMQYVLYILFELNPIKTSYLLLISMILLSIGIWVNRRFQGFILIGIGILTNMLSLLLNKGSMPVVKRSAELAGVTLSEDQRHIIYNKGVWILSDWIPLYHTVYSIGDIFVGVGLIVFMIKCSKSFNTSYVQKA